MKTKQTGTAPATKRICPNERSLATWLIISLFLVLAIIQTCEAQTTKKKQHTIALEIDPAPFIMEGHSFSVRYSNENLPHWSFTGSTFSGKYPNGLLSKANKNNGWENLEFKCSNAVFADYHINADRKGLFFGPSLFSYKNEIENKNAGNKIRFRTVYPNVRVGYNWFPIKKLDLYLSPWVNVGKEFSIDSRNKYNNLTYQTNNIKYIAALHIGYKYSF
jgi:hypothetical protein